MGRLDLLNTKLYTIERAPHGLAKKLDAVDIVHVRRFVGRSSV